MREQGLVSWEEKTPQKYSQREEKRLFQIRIKATSHTMPNLFIVSNYEYFKTVRTVSKILLLGTESPPPHPPLHPHDMRELYWEVPWRGFLFPQRQELSRWKKGENCWLLAGPQEIAPIAPLFPSCREQEFIDCCVLRMPGRVVGTLVLCWSRVS